MISKEDKCPANYLFSLSLSGRTALVKVRTAKVVLAALCTATVEEKFTCKKKSVLILIDLFNSYTTRHVSANQEREQSWDL